jgi:hypothetical protein
MKDSSPKLRDEMESGIPFETLAGLGSSELPAKTIGRVKNL